MLALCCIVGPDDIEGRLWVMTGSEYIPSHDKIEKERTVYYMPSSRHGRLSSTKNGKNLIVSDLFCLLFFPIVINLTEG